jgi:CDP-glucose 4,6-dehydratase
MEDRPSAVEDLEMNEKFWADKRIFLTGHTGFKGSWLSLMLQNLGAKVTGYSLIPSTEPNLFEVADVANGMTSIIGDICDLPTLQSAMGAAEPDIVIHMAAQPLVRHSYVEPVETYETNVMGTVNVLEAVRHTSCIKAVLVVTTDKCYENREWVWGYREDDALGGFDPYSSSKACSEIVSSAYRSSYFVNKNVRLATARAGNVIGGGDWAKDRLIPDLIRSFENNEVAFIRNPKSIRPWQHVFEPLRGYIMLTERLYSAENEEYSRAWNFGPTDHDCKPVDWIASKMSSLWGDNASWTSGSSSELHEAKNLKLDTSLVTSKLGWIPILSLEQGLVNLIEWNKEYLKFENARDVSLAQIQKYMQDSL